MVRIEQFVVAFVCITGLAALAGCSCPCAEFTLDQHDAVGAFVSLSEDPTNADLPVRVGPARIRAWNGETVSWVIENPSKTEVKVFLHSVWPQGTSPSNNVKSSLITSTNEPVTVPANCGLAQLRARLSTSAVPSSRDTCRVETFQYNFKLVITDSDSIGVKILYDPELVVEGQP